MLGLVLYEDEGYANFLPLVGWRSVAELRVGRKIVLDVVAQRLGLPVVGVWTRDWLAPVAAQRCGAPANQPLDGPAILANGRWLPEGEVQFSESPTIGVIGDEIAYIVCDATLATRLTPADLLDPERRCSVLDGVPQVEAPGCLIRYPWDVIGNLDMQLSAEWGPADARIESEVHSDLVLNELDCLHIGQRSSIHPTAVIDASKGPIFISHDVDVGAHAVVEGPAYIGPGTRINPHAWLHGGVAVGPVCRLGGEIDKCVIHGYTNKQHTGFLGHSYVGSWVNIGAAASNSDLKNTYGKVQVPIRSQRVETNETFFGAIIGDFAKLGIQAALPTGAVIGFAAVIATTRFTPQFVPSFAWLTDAGLSRGKHDALLDAATRMMFRRQIDMTDAEIELFLDLGERIKALESSAH